MEPLILIDNPGSASRKYGLYSGQSLRARLHFEHKDGRYEATLHQGQDSRQIPITITDLKESTSQVTAALQSSGALKTGENIGYIGLRIVAPSDFFLKDCIIDSAVIDRLKKLEPRAPLHIQAALDEIELLLQHFPTAKIIGVSDSAFHMSKPEHAWNYGLPLEDANRLEVKRFGYHGISLASAVYYLQKANKLLARMVVCHLGSGDSITALRDGKSIDNSMGYSPLEGLVMATRSGSIDPVAVGVLRDALGLDNETMENYLNTKGGLLGLSGSSSEIPELLQSESDGDRRAHLALETYLYSVRKTIGQMSAALDGLDGLVFTGTVGERSSIIRERIVNELSFLGLALSQSTNQSCENAMDVTIINDPKSKPILVVPADEAGEMCRRVQAIAAV